MVSGFLVLEVVDSKPRAYALGLFLIRALEGLWFFGFGSLVVVEGLIFDPSLTETHEVSGFPMVARITKSRPIWGSRLVVARAMGS